MIFFPKYETVWNKPLHPGLTYQNRPIIFLEKKLYFRHFSWISRGNKLYSSKFRHFLPIFQKTRGKVAQCGINRFSVRPGSCSIVSMIIIFGSYFFRNFLKEKDKRNHVQIWKKKLV